MHHALFAQPLQDGCVECRLCAHFCRLRPGQTGICQVRQNRDGALVTTAYNRPVLLALEPIEKKFFFHVAPGSQTLSLGTAGCNLRCRYCINWHVSQRGVSDAERVVTPAEVVARARAMQASCIAFTYTEPTIFFEYASEIAQQARQAGLTIVAKSNGYMAPEVLEEMAGWLHAINIDLKGWGSAAHQRIVGGELRVVLDNLRLAARLGLWLEVTTLLIPGLSQDTSDRENIAHFIANELGPQTPWHLLRFYPHYKMRDQAVTSQAILQQAVESGQNAGLQHIYCKELERGRKLHTYCPTCRALLIERAGYSLVSNNLRDGACGTCGSLLQGYRISARQESTQIHSTEVKAWQINQSAHM